MRNKIVVAALCVMSAGCQPAPNMQMQNEQKYNAAPMHAQNTHRFTVERVGVFEDNLAYNNRRGIYILRDKESGAEYVGVSGVGISSLGSHSVSCGKTQCIHEDER